MTTRGRRPRDYSERLIKGHVVGIERLEPQRWRVTVDGRRHFTFCSESRAWQAGTLEAGRLAFSAADACGGAATGELRSVRAAGAFPASSEASRGRRHRLGAPTEIDPDALVRRPSPHASSDDTGRKPGEPHPALRHDLNHG